MVRIIVIHIGVVILLIVTATIIAKPIINNNNNNNNNNNKNLHLEKECSVRIIGTMSSLRYDGAWSFQGFVHKEDSEFYSGFYREPMQRSQQERCELRWSTLNAGREMHHLRKWDVLAFESLLLNHWPSRHTGTAQTHCRVQPSSENDSVQAKATFQNFFH